MSQDQQQARQIFRADFNLTGPIIYCHLRGFIEKFIAKKQESLPLRTMGDANSRRTQLIRHLLASYAAHRNQ